MRKEVKTLTADDVVRAVRAKIAETFEGKAFLFAEHVGVPQSFLSSVLTGKKKPSPKILAAIGVRRTVFIRYERVL